MSEPLDQAVGALMKQAHEQLTEGRFEDAVETFSASLAMAPQEGEALRGRGLAYLQLKRWALAAADFEAARALDPDNPDHWVDLGISLAMDSRIYPAIATFDTLLARQPECVRGHLELGLLYLRIGAVPKGRDCLQQALRFRPTLAQRRLIEATLSEQERFDRKRFYRPDFEALRRRAPWTAGGGWVTQALRALKQKFGGAAP